MPSYNNVLNVYENIRKNLLIKHISIQPCLNVKEKIFFFVEGKSHKS